LSLYGCAIALAAAALVLVVMNSLMVAILLASSLTVLTVVFLALVTVRARLARRRSEIAASSPSASVHSVSPGGALGRH